MQIIAQRLNSGGSRRVAEAIQSRDAGAIAEIAREQAQAGADYLDVNAAAWGAAQEPEALCWLVETVQAAVSVPLSLDSVNPDALRLVLPLCRRPPLLNCFSGASLPAPTLLSLVREHSPLPVVAVCYDGRETRTDAGQRLEIAVRLVMQLQALGVGEDNVILDPVTLPFACGEEALQVTLETIIGLKGQFPHARVLGVPGNFSHGLARRRGAEGEYLRRAREAGANVFLCDITRPSLRRFVL